MHECDVLIVGGGPAGSSCAWGLVDSGLDVSIVDRARFPRDKTCAGWVTPNVWERLEIDLSHYATSRTLQPITGFRTGLLGEDLIQTDFGEVVSYGIRRCEFDHYLLQRCGARVMTGLSASSIERDNSRWIVNGDFAARALVAAGGQFCPVARWVGAATRSSAPLVTAQEVEFEADLDDTDAAGVSGSVPALFFCEDLNGYGWCFRKGKYLNIGLGHTSPQRLKSDLNQLCEQLADCGIVDRQTVHRLHGHAYRLGLGYHRPVLVNDVLLIGDAAGLADPRSGEGILAAIESGLSAADVIVRAFRDDRIHRLLDYHPLLRDGNLGPEGLSRSSERNGSLRLTVGRSLMRSRWFARHVLLNRWFLHRS